jgi:transcriptional regulator with XRE-family HTH domain
VTGEELKRLRERRGLERQELADAINLSIGTAYSGESIARWERGREPAKKVTAFLEELAVSEFAGVTAEPQLEPSELPLDEPAADAGDTPPGPGPTARPTPQPAIGGGPWVRACEELWEMIATGVGMVGAATGNLALVNDGAVIAQDKAALGAAWGKLAETNETFRRMLVGMTEGGAWLQVSLVTGTTFSKCWQGHVAYNEHNRGVLRDGGAQEPANGRVERDHLAETG